MKKTIHADNTTTQYTYDGPGNQTSITDQAGAVIQYTYDAANQLRSVIQASHPNPPQNTTAYTYDNQGNLNASTDANAHATQGTFDALSRLMTETLPLGQNQTRTYDAAGNLSSLTDFNGKTTTYTYDSMNRLLSKIPDASFGEPTISFTYTPTGKRASMTDSSGTTTYTYDSQDRLKTKSTPQGTLSYSYDAAGNVASMVSSNTNGLSVAYTYDNLNRLSTVMDNRLPVGQNTTTYTYDSASNLATMTYPNGLQSTFTYDSLNRLRATNGYAYQLTPAGSRQSSTEPGGRTLNWTNDGIYRLTSETITLDPAGKNGTVNYGLDPAGNRLSQASTVPGISAGTFGYDANDRLATETYDNNGNTLVTGARSFAYDSENRIKSMNSGAVTLQHDGDGNTVAKTVAGVTTHFLVDDLNPTGYAQVVEELVNGGVRQVYTLGVQRLSQNQLLNSVWTPSFYGYDGFGNTRHLTNAAGAITDTYDYDAWGNAVNVTGTTINPYLYVGEYYDSDLGLYYLRTRYLNPLSGRFVTRDTYSGDILAPQSLHKYTYAENDPVNFRDPTGQSKVEKSLLSTINSTLLRYPILTRAQKGICFVWSSAIVKLAYAIYVGKPGEPDILSTDLSPFLDALCLLGRPRPPMGPRPSPLPQPRPPAPGAPRSPRPAIPPAPRPPGDPGLPSLPRPALPPPAGPRPSLPTPAPRPATPRPAPPLPFPPAGPSLPGIGGLGG